MPSDWAHVRRIDYRRGVAASWINAVHREVLTQNGETIAYDRLLLTTGALPFVPTIESFGLGGIFVMRTIDDAVQLQQHIRRRRCRTAVVVGGGLLGLETAYSMSQLDVRVFVLDLASWPLSRQLDRPGGALLWQMMSDLGVKILPQMEARRILGTEWVEAVELSNGSTLSADLCLVAAGIRPNAALAESAGLVVRRGVGRRRSHVHVRSSHLRRRRCGGIRRTSARTMAGGNGAGSRGSGESSGKRMQIRGRNAADQAQSRRH